MGTLEVFLFPIHSIMRLSQTPESTDFGVSLPAHPIFEIHFNSINNAYSICSDSLDLPREGAHGALVPLSQHQQHNLQVPVQNESVGPVQKSRISNGNHTALK